jgi:diguanylate cyclase (GGDEF)-like protein
LVGLGVFATSRIEDGRSAVRAARAVDDHARAVDRLVKLEVAVVQEATYVGGQHAAFSYGVPLATMGNLLHLDLEGGVISARHSTDRALRDVAREIPDSEAVARAIATARAASASHIVPSYYQAIRASTDQIGTILVHLDRAGDAVRSQAVRRRAAGMAEVSVAISSAQMEMMSLSGSLGQALPSANIGLPEASSRGLARLADRFQDHAQLALGQLTPDLRARWTSVLNSQTARSINQAVENTIAQGRPGAPQPSFADLAPLANAMLTRNVELSGVLGQAANELRAAARVFRSAALRDLESAGGIVGAITLATLAAMAFVSRSVTQPLTLLERRAEAAVDALSVEPPSESRGPREVRVVKRALDALVVNVSALRRQADALAAGDVDASCLSETLPGPIGEALQATVARLARSISDGEELRAELKTQATHDPLTGLPNRAFLLEHFENVRPPVGVLFVDLDYFKEANDRLGHASGDVILQAVAQRLRSVVRDADVVARFGGDEFVVVLHDVTDDARLAELGQRIIESIEGPITVGEGNEVALSATVGGSTSRGSTFDAGALLARADHAMYEGKARGRGTVTILPEPGIATSTAAR